ncbi:MAG: class I SAM-dependent methyltransferase [Clostridiaceae bacterium]
MDCYNDFAFIYDKLITKDINYKDWSKYIISICKNRNIEYNEYLDLACGTGNMTCEIEKYFNQTYAVDLSSDMLTLAKNKLSNKTKLICQDISDINLNKKFNLITCCLDSMNYLTEKTDLEKFFCNVNMHLEQEGIFIFDVNSYYKLSYILGNNIYNYDNEDVYYIWENNFEDDLLNMYLTFFIKDEDKYIRFDEEHLERAYTEEYLDELIDSSGFEILEKHDGYSENIISEKTERIVYVLKLKNKKEIKNG